MSYTLTATPRANRDLDALPEAVRKAIGLRIDALSTTPRPPGIVRVESQPPGNYRLRVRDYRVGYFVDDEARTVTVWQVGHRSKFYDRATRRRR